MVQKIIQIGTSAGVTIPKKQLEQMGLGVGDSVEITIKRTSNGKHSEDQSVIEAAKKILQDYRQDFQNLAKR